VYIRFQNNKAVAQFLTYFTSGFWHGFHPGYYLSFISGALVTASGRALRRNIQPLFNTKGSALQRFKPLYDFSGRILTVAVMSYVFLPAGIREWSASITTWKETYFVGHLLCLGTLLLLDVFKVGNLLQRLAGVNQPVGSDRKIHVD
jgi:lysophospholipid acyltransferase